MLAIQKSGGLKSLRDGFADLVGGMDTSTAPDLISPRHAALGVNVSFRGGKPKTRPAFAQLELNPSPSLDNLKDGKFQGGVAYYSTDLGRSLLIGVYSGWILSIDKITRSVTTLNPGDRNDHRRKHYMTQAENFLVIQNGVDIPLIWSGTGLVRRSKTGDNNQVLGTQNTSIVNVAGVATVTTQTVHGLVNDDYVQIDGTDRAGYANQFYIYDVSPLSFKINVDSTLANPLIFGTTRYVPEVPTGLVMAYGQGRLFVSSANRVEITAGDIIYGDIKGAVGNILRWTENQYLAEGLSFRLSTNQGRINAMVFPTFQDTAAGQGELFVYGEYGVTSFQVSAPRSAILKANGETLQPGWRDIQIQKIVLSGSGCTSQWSVINFTNGDMFYRDLVGIRSYRNARGDMQSYGQTPISAELNRILDHDVKTRLGNISATHFDDRVLMTCSPRYDVRKIRIVSAEVEATVVKLTLADKHDIEVGTTVTIGSAGGINGVWVVTEVGDYEVGVALTPPSAPVITGSSYIESIESGSEIFHKAVAVLDFNSTSTVGGKSSAAWDGIWSGINFQQIVSGFFDGQVRCFSFVYGGVGDNQIWEITSDFDDDQAVGQDPTPIQCQLETKSYSFDQQFNKKKLRRLDIWISDLRGKVDFEAYYRFDGRSCWTAWPPKWSRCATVASFILPETNENVEDLLQNLPQVRNQITHPLPPNVCEATQGGFTHTGFEVQLRLVWSGKMTIDKALILADEVVESTRATCPAGALE